MKLTPAVFLCSLAVTAHGADAVLTFEKDVRPILKTHCTHCHGEEEKPKGKLDLRLRRFMDKVVVAGDPAKSKLVELIRSGEMPEKGKPLAQAELNVIEKWITQGAKTVKAEPLALAPGPIISDEDREYWAFQPIQKPEVPKNVEAQKLRTPVDAFVLAKMNEKGLQMAPEADRRTLIRRVTLDLTGLLPTPDEVEAFVADKSPLAYEQLVERLLASKNYGERWARHWLDLVHYGETHGYDKDKPRMNAWPYRDYVIRALNSDKPYARFIEEQIAGDEIGRASCRERVSSPV